MNDSEYIAKLEKLYSSRKVYQGELHDHANTGGTSDGKRPLSVWVEAMKMLDMDFAAILDHRQVRHMYQPEWQDGLFIAGTEPGTEITDADATVKQVHYNMLFSDRDELAKLLDEFPEYQYEGGIEGHFIYPKFTRESFGKLIDAVKAHEGFFVHPHPKQLMQAEDPNQYWFRDETGIEVFYNSMDSEHMQANYELWTALLEEGRRVWACAGCDKHADAENGALTTIYASAKSSRGFVERLRAGDFTCGNAGIRMCIGDTLMGGKCAFEGKKLTVAVGDIHSSVNHADHEYRADIITDEGIIHTEKITPVDMNYIVMDAPECKFCRVEVFDETTGIRIAIGNPIWNRE